MTRTRIAGTRADSAPPAPPVALRCTLEAVRTPSPRPAALSYPLALVIRAYQALLSPLFPNTCKYHPSCSQYALDAFRRYGLVRGFVLAGWRLLRCNPWSHGGVDRVEDQRLFR